MKHQDQTERDRQARDLFLRAVEIHLPEAQAAYLEGACQHDASLRSRVEDLLRNHRQDSFLETAAISGPPMATGPTASTEGRGTVIGRYTLLQMIGQGGSSKKRGTRAGRARRAGRLQCRILSARRQ